jgi:eukaryotic-like serine/threonine-protein kinase
VLYHLVAGRPPFDAVQQQAIMHQIYHGTPPPLATLRDGVPEALQALIERGLSKDRDLRPATWDEFSQALSQLSAQVPQVRGSLQEVLDSERFTLLRSLEFFVDFGDVELWEVVHRATWHRHSYGQALFRQGEEGNRFHIVTQGQVEVYREGRSVATLGAGSTVGEMAYLAPNPALRVHTVDILVSQPATTVSFTPDSLESLSLPTRYLFDKAFIRVLVRRLHAAQEAAPPPRRTP